TYGILSVLAQAFYHAEYLFTVPPEVFDPPPNVESGVIRLTRKDNYDQLGCAPAQLYKVVKMAFQQRRKTLRNSLKQMDLSEEIKANEIFNLRPEQLDVEQFVALTNLVLPK
ncbi:MAG: rRNA adenine N-6-methyltransferase family protein, partial [Leeuwenhoekiella sp.]